MASNSPKNRDYFITINKGAECYNELKEIIETPNYKLYAMIKHDKDILLDMATGETTPKVEHYHIMIELKNPISFNSIQNKFKGAHIEVPKYKKSTYQYLLHNSPNSKEKYQYDFTEIISNNLELVKDAIENEDFEIFKENQWLRYMAEGTITSYQFVKRFGMNVYKQYWSVYAQMIKELENDAEMQRDYELLKHDMTQERLPF